MKLAFGVLVMVAAATPAFAQFGVPDIGQFHQLVIAESQEVALGENVSENLRNRFGVWQNLAVHRYVALLGTTLASVSERPTLRWTFIVLDTDGVNAFAAPGGYVHVTRGLLAMMRNEAELAGVLAHEIGHIEGKHIVHQMIRQAAIDRGTKAVPGGGLVKFIARRAYDAVVENKFDRNEELDADARAIRLAQTSKYAPGMLGHFLIRLRERNKDIQDPKFRNGLFASHPDISERVDRIVSATATATATALGAARLAAELAVKLMPLESVTILTEAEPEFVEPPEEGLRKIFRRLGRGKPRTQPTVTDAQLAIRRVERDRHATGGDNPQLVRVDILPSELEEFKLGIV